MANWKWIITAGGLLLAITWIPGCNENPGTPAESGAHPAASHADQGHAEHAHPARGPHGGDLIELGNEDFHAELVHDHSGTVTVYVLDSQAKAPVPIPSGELTINLTHEGQGAQFKLTALPESGDPQGQSSRFTSSDETLAQCLEDPAAGPQLVATIQGKQYRGSIQHGPGHPPHAAGEHVPAAR